MRSKVRPAKRIYTWDEWRPFFSIRPRKIFLGPQTETSNYTRPYQWVCFETVERKRSNEYFDSPWIYRIYPQEEEVCETEIINKSPEPPMGEAFFTKYCVAFLPQGHTSCALL